MSRHVLLCLKCRGQGHLVKECKQTEWRPEYEWLFSDARLSLNFLSAWETNESSICARCQALDLLDLLNALPPWHSQSDLRQTLRIGSEPSQNLGKTGSIQLWEDCTVCRCLFTMTLNPSSADQDVILLPDWSVRRVTGEMEVKLDTDEKRQYATCLMTILLPSPSNMDLPVHLHRSDALCLMESRQRTLGGRRIVRDISIAKRWLTMCLQRHGSYCAPVLTEELEQVSLVDIETRRVVSYPGKVDYVALSYVWGDTAQTSYKPGDHLNDLPQTLEDAMLCTKTLGIRYIWIDSLCINQADEREKQDQINRMWSIYRGAYVTIICLSGNSANAGIYRTSYAQATCLVEGKRLVALMPTLSQQIWMCPWGKRAWTFQECLLSSRCLFFSDHQIYFDCNAMQCCESLDETRSWGHHLTPSANPTNEDFITWMMTQVGAGGLRNPLEEVEHRLGHWGYKLNLYSYRTMTLDEDAIRAFEGVLQRLKILYPRGFFWGLPIEDFDWGLVWRSQWPPTRRKGFPSWSWAGWKGGLWFGQPRDLTKTRLLPVSLEISTLKAGVPEQIFKTEKFVLNETDRAGQTSLALDFRVGSHQHAEQKGYLYISATCFKFALDFSRPRRYTPVSGQPATFDLWIRGTRCCISIMSTDQEILKNPEEKSFILVARDIANGLVSHHLMLVSESDGIARRETILELLIPSHKLDVLEDLNPIARQIVLC